MILKKIFGKIFHRKEINKSSDINPNDKINYNEFDLLDDLNMRAFESFALTLNRENYVPVEVLDRVCLRIYKTQKKRYRKLNKSNKDYQKWFKENLPRLLAERQQKLLQEQLQQLKAAEKEQKDNA